jgi:hypothetical protein
VNTTLGHIAALRAGYPFRTSIQHDPDGTVALIQGRDVDANRLRIAPAQDGLAQISSSGIRNLSDHLLQPGDVILMARGPRNYAVPIGETSGQAIVPGSFHVLRPDAQLVFPPFLAWWLNQDASQQFMQANNSGTTIPMISLEVLRALPVQLPPLDVQRRVAELNLLIEQEHNLMNQLSTARRDLLRGWANQNTAHA